MDAMDCPMKHRTQAQSIFERAPGLFHALQLLVTQGEVCRGEAIVVAMDYEFSVETFFLPLLRSVNPQQAAFGQPEITTVAAARPQLTHPLGMTCTTDLLEARQFGFEFAQYLLTMGFLPFLFLRVVTPNRATTTFPFAYDDFLDPQVVRDALIATGAL